MPHINTSGSGALIIDAELARRSWTGFYLRAKFKRRYMADLETNDGTQWKIQDVFNFKHPVTDYDRLCARRHRGGLRINKLRRNAFLSISNGDDVLGWWPEAGIFTTGWVQSPSHSDVLKARFSKLGDSGLFFWR